MDSKRLVPVRIHSMGQGGHGSTGNEGVFHILRCYRIGASPPDDLVSYLGLIFFLGGGVDRGASQCILQL